MVTRVLKIREHEFEGDKGEMIKGSFVYLSVEKDNGSLENRRIFVGDDRMADWAYVPHEGDKVLVFAKDGKVIDMLKA